MTKFVSQIEKSIAVALIDFDLFDIYCRRHNVILWTTFHIGTSILVYDAD